MDEELAQWLAGLIAQAILGVQQNAGLTCEIIGDTSRWVQVVPEQPTEDDGQQSISGLSLNFAYRHNEEPLEKLEALGLKPPPGTTVTAWEPDAFTTLHLRPDIPVIALAFFIGDVFGKVQAAPQGYDISVKLDYGY